MASSKHQPPQPAPLPNVGGSYLLDPATGQWILQEPGAEPPPAAAEPETLIIETDGFDAEAPAAGET